MVFSPIPSFPISPTTPQFFPWKGPTNKINQTTVTSDAWWSCMWRNLMLRSDVKPLEEVVSIRQLPSCISVRRCLGSNVSWFTSTRKVGSSPHECCPSTHPTSLFYTCGSLVVTLHGKCSLCACPLAKTKPRCHELLERRTQMQNKSFLDLQQEARQVFPYNFQIQNGHIVSTWLISLSSQCTVVQGGWAHWRWKRFRASQLAQGNSDSVTNFPNKGFIRILIRTHKDSCGDSQRFLLRIAVV